MMHTQQDILLALQSMEDELDIYDYFIDKALMSVIPDIRQPENQIKGCVSGLWVSVHLKDGTIEAVADSDSLIIKGIASVICDIYSGLTLSQAQACPIVFLDGLDLAGELDDTRRSGLRRMIHIIQNTNGGKNT